MRHLRSFLLLLSISRIAQFGAAITSAAFIADMILIVSEMMQPHTNAYVGIVAYMVLPGLFVFGLLIIPIGMVFRLRRTGKLSLAQLEDLAQQRKIRLSHVAQMVSTLTLLNLVVLGVVGYRGIEYTDSTEFCGEVCHEVMRPEYVSHARSPHSQISCAHCHIGPGADWFVRSKLSGARQVLAVMTDSYSRPIETPVENLRPARDVCEVCHRPEMFHGNLLKVIQQYNPDEKNTTTYTVLNMLVGGGDTPDSLHGATGIHWHTSREHQVRYFAADRKREDIKWVELINPDGSRRIWQNPDHPMTEAEILEAEKGSEVRTMDCVDCHNRPTHIFIPASAAMDLWLSRGQINDDIPWIRKVGEEILSTKYKTTEEAMAGLAKLPEFYAQEYPDLAAKWDEQLRETVPALQEIYGQYVFPEMNIQWDTYYSLIGHPTKQTSGCFRCHNGVLRDEQGKSITIQCDACHHVLADHEEHPAILRQLQTVRGLQ